MSGPTRRDWELLGVEAGADRAAIDRAYRAAKACFAPAELATYGLFEGDERRELEERLDRAYLRITGEATVPPTPAPAPSGQPDPEPDPGPLPDRETAPGRFLEAIRERRGISREEIAHETKIRVWLLEQLEHENFHKLPAPVYVRGFVLQVATLLGVADPEELARSYVRTLQR
jgi:hypothetical protein